MRSWVGNIAAQRIIDFAELADEYAGEGTVGTNNTAGLTGHARIDLGREDLQKMFGKSGLFTDLMFDKPEPVSGKDTPTLKDDVYNGRPPAPHGLITNLSLITGSISLWEMIGWPRSFQVRKDGKL